MDITVKELSKLKQEAESDIAKEVSRILEDFKEKSGIRCADHSVYIDMVYSRTIDNKYSEAFVSDASIRMEIF
jgi:hypothetical protein